MNEENKPLESEEIAQAEDSSSLGEYNYKLSYEAVMEGIKLFTLSPANKIALKKEKTQKIIIGICTLASILAVIFLRNLLAVVALVICVIYFGLTVVSPENKKKKAAKMIADKDGEYKVCFHENRFDIYEGNMKNEFFYLESNFLEGETVFTLINKGVLVTLPKSYFGDDLSKIREKLSSSCKSF